MSDDKLPPVTPFPKPPDPADYEHLTEYERLVCGLPYRPVGNEELNERKDKVRELLEKFNGAPANDSEGRKEILKELLHPSCLDKRNIWIKPPFFCSMGKHLKVGHNFFANTNCCFYDTAPIEFGNDCKLGPSVQVITPTHPVDSSYRLCDDKSNYYELALSIKVGDNAWLGAGSIICPGVTLGDNVVVGAGAVVTKSFPSNVVIAGSPARVIRHMPEPTKPETPIWKD